MSQLAKIAMEMREEILPHENGWAWRNLSRGLQVILARTDGSNWRLAIARPTVYPSETEAVICTNIFGVPVSCEPWKHVVRKHREKRHVVEWTWIEELSGQPSSN